MTSTIDAPPLAATRTERRVAFALALGCVALTVALLPFAAMPGPRAPRVIGISDAGIAIADAATAWFLAHEFRGNARTSFLLLACAYLFGSIMAVLQASAFPGAVFATPLFGTAQTPGWLFLLWRLGTGSLFLASVIVAGQSMPNGRHAVAGAFGTVTVVALGFAAAASRLDVPITAGTSFTTYNIAFTALYLAVCATALALIVRRRQLDDAIHLYLALVLVASICDQTLAVFAGGQYTVGWQADKAMTVTASAILLVFWLARKSREGSLAPNSAAAYGAAIAVMTAALIVRWFVSPWLGPHLPFATTFGAVAIAVWIGGWQPATVAALIGLAGGGLLFREASAGDTFGAASRLIGTAVYAMSCALIIGLGDTMRRARDAHRMAEARFRQSQEASIQGYAMFTAVRDADGAIRDFRCDYINPRGAAMGGRTPDELVGRMLAEAAPGTKRSGVFDLLSAALESGRASDTEVRFESKGVERWFRNLIAPVGDSVSVWFFDVTETKRLEAQLRQRAADLQRADANKSQFLALLSHELRNPLAPLLNGLTLLRLRNDPCATAETIDMMHRQVAHLRRLIDDLLDVSRIDRGKLDLERERVAIDVVVRSAIETAKPNIEAKSHALVVRYAPEPIYVDGDRVRLSQVLSNLLNNAAKYTPPKGSIEIATRVEGADAVVCVRDSGAGFAAGDERRIFDMFVQLDAGRAGSAGGLGLGLTLARSIVEMHGGSIRASSAGPGHGAEFAVRLPLAVTPAPSQAPAPGRSTAVARRRVLVVDDNADAARTLEQILVIEGFDVRAANDARTALAIAREFAPEVAFLDLNMPQVSGLELARALRALPGARDMRLVAVTGMGQAGDVQASRDAGFDAHLTKPAAVEDLVRLASDAPSNVVAIGALHRRVGD